MIKLFIPFIKSNKNWYENVTAEGNQVQFGLIISKRKLFPRFFFSKITFFFYFYSSTTRCYTSQSFLFVKNIKRSWVVNNLTKPKINYFEIEDSKTVIYVCITINIKVQKEQLFLSSRCYNRDGGFPYGPPCRLKPS